MSGKQLKHINRRLTEQERARHALIRAAADLNIPPKSGAVRTAPAPGIPAKIRNAREAHGLSWYALAKLAGIAKSTTIRDIELGKDVKVSDLKSIAAAFGASVGPCRTGCVATFVMKRKLRWLLILVILAGFAVWLEPTRVVWGWLRGEAFYDGRPTSWWEAELARWDMLELGLLLDEPGRIDPHGTAFFERTRQGAFGWFFALFGRDENPARPIPKALLDTDGPTLLHGDLAAEPVLRVLIEHRDPHVRQLATFGLQRLEAIRQNKGRRLPRF